MYFRKLLFKPVKNAIIQRKGGVAVESLKATELFLVDMDGTFYLEDTLLPGAKEFLRAVQESGKRAVFLTNNSSRTNSEYADKMANFGFCMGADDIFTSADATIAYMKKHYEEKRTLVIGTDALVHQFRKEHFYVTDENPEVVVLGFDTSINYEKLTALCNAVRNGAIYIATHPDFNCPVKGGYIPDIGAVIAFVKAATEKEPDVIIGKPYAPIIEAVTERFGMPTEKTTMIGDRLYTDIAMGKWGIKTALVLTGETKKEDLEASDVKPDYIFENIGEIATILK